MFSPAICNVDAPVQDLVAPSVPELSARLDLGALELGLCHAAAREAGSGVVQGSCALVGDSDSAANDHTVAGGLRGGESDSARVTDSPNDGQSGAPCDAAIELVDERDDWIRRDSLLERIMDVAVAEERA